MFKEASQLLSGHGSSGNTTAPSQREGWTVARQWIKSNGYKDGTPSTRPRVPQAIAHYIHTLVFADNSWLRNLCTCLKMVNLVDTLDAREDLEQWRVQVYVTVALRIDSLGMPLGTLLARYLWRKAMYEASDCGSSSAPQKTDENDVWMRALLWDVHQGDATDRVDSMVGSVAWQETLSALKKRACLCPIATLSTYHLIDNIRTQLGRLVISMMDATPPMTADYFSISSETMFDPILQLHYPSPLILWLASVGATVEALAKSDLKTAKQRLLRLAPPAHDDDDDTIDQGLKRKMGLDLSGAIRLQEGDCAGGVQDLYEAQKWQEAMRKSWTHHHRRRCQVQKGLESSAMALAEFVVSLTGLQAWIVAWCLGPSSLEKEESWDQTMMEQVRNECLGLRRMLNCRSLERLPTNPELIDRLSRLSYFVSRQSDGSDSNSEEDEEVCCSSEPRERRADRAMDILHGLT